LLAPGNVAHRDHGKDRLTTLIFDQSPTVVESSFPLLVKTPDNDFQITHFFTAKDARQWPLINSHHIAVDRREFKDVSEFVEMAKTFLQTGKAMHFAGSRVEVQELTMKIGNNQTFGKTLHNRLQPSLVLPPQHFGTPALSNVVRQNYLGVTANFNG